MRKILMASQCAAALALGACHSAPTRLYTLDPAVPATHIDAYAAPALRVDTVSVPASWDRIEILASAAAGKIEFSEFDHWSAPLTQLARQALSDDLERRLPPGSVIYPRLPKTEGALGVNVDILEFNILTSRVSMRASWLIVPPAGPQSAKRGVASLQFPMASTEPVAVAHAWSELLGQLADHIAADAATIFVP